MKGTHSLIATGTRVMPQMNGIAPDDFASMEMLLPGEWKKPHPESYRNRYAPDRMLSLFYRLKS